MSTDKLRRWRLVLGRYASESMPQALGRQDGRIDQALDYLYGREYERKGLVQRGGSGTLDPSQLRAVDWLETTRKLFPRDVYERLQADAVDRYQIREVLNDAKVIESLEPSQALARSLLSMRGKLRADVLEAVRKVIRRSVEEIVQKLRQDFVNALTGRRNRFRRSQLPSAQNFDWRATVRANLRHYDPERQRLVIERPLFNGRIKRSLPWDVILCVDQSGSMSDSVMYSAVVASILAGLPGVNVRLLVFDTTVVDLSHIASDPVEVLMTVQLGGGTNIGLALERCERLVRQPQRTVVALVSDMCEGAPPQALLAAVRRLAEARVRLLGLAALDAEAQPIYDVQMAQKLAAAGMEVAALTPLHFAEWLGEVMA
jgi:Mg-chelatase subunit ChlD